ncbi:MAG: hypothetical protein DBX49_03520 [Clostridia bacterium]|nr:MAG: hypothetical protein DBX49_03520 [Clostridia bacterium]
MLPQELRSFSIILSFKKFFFHFPLTAEKNKSPDACRERRRRSSVYSAHGSGKRFGRLFPAHKNILLL